MAPERIDEPLLVRALHDAGDYWEKLLLTIIDERKARAFFVDPQEPPTSKQSYITRFQGKNSIGGEGKEGSEEGGNEEEEERGRGRKRSEPPLGSGAGSGDKKTDKKASYWKEKEVKAIRDLLSASGDILGLKRTLEYMKCGKRTRWLADEYVALKPCGEGAMQIREDIAVRRVYEEGKEAAPPSKCSKSGAHNNGESYIWQHMTRVYVKGEAGSAAAPSLLYGICHECDKALKCPANFGNGNLNKHLARVHDIHSPCKTQCVMTEGKGLGRRAVRV